MELLEVVTTKRFEKDLKKVRKQKKDLKRLDTILQQLLKNQALPIKYRDHVLKGQYAGYRECHIEPDWLLIYKASNQRLYLVRTGSHSELFK